MVSSHLPHKRDLFEPVYRHRVAGPREPTEASATDTDRCVPLKANSFFSSEFFTRSFGEPFCSFKLALLICVQCMLVHFKCHSHFVLFVFISKFVKALSN